MPGSKYGRIGPGANGGFTLVEALIAGIVLSIGMLGSGAMLLRSLQASGLALQRSVAVLLAADMADRIRANRLASASFALESGTFLSAPRTTCNASDPCTPNEFAEFELYDWQEAVLRALPEAQPSITVDSASFSGTVICTITIEWAQSNDDALAATRLTVRV